MLRETDLYIPVKEYLEHQGFIVRGEVGKCDVVGYKGEDVVVVELKKAINITLLLQALDRQKITDLVYIAVPHFDHTSKTRRGSSWRMLQQLLKRLELGLLLVSFKGKKASVEVVFEPQKFIRRKNKKYKENVLKEATKRSYDGNVGGSTRQKRLTVYRENSIHIACVLKQLGPLKISEIKKFNTGIKTQSILYKNFYGWFEKQERGVYCISKDGEKELELYPDAVHLYSELVSSVDLVVDFN